MARKGRVTAGPDRGGALRARWVAITELAVSECGGIEPAKRWLNTSKIALKGKTPLEAMTTDAGCDVVEKLLHELNL